jgi:hypothetical protein
LHGLDHLLQRGDRFIGRRAVHRTLAGRIVTQLSIATCIRWIA